MAEGLNINRSAAGTAAPPRIHCKICGLRCVDTDQACPFDDVAADVSSAAHTESPAISTQAVKPQGATQPVGSVVPSSPPDESPPRATPLVGASFSNDMDVDEDDGDAHFDEADAPLSLSGASSQASQLKVTAQLARSRQQEPVVSSTNKDVSPTGTESCSNDKEPAALPSATSPALLAASASRSSGATTKRKRQPHSRSTDPVTKPTQTSQRAKMVAAATKPPPSIAPVQEPPVTQNVALGGVTDTSVDLIWEPIQDCVAAKLGDTEVKAFNSLHKLVANAPALVTPAASFEPMIGTSTLDG